MEEFSGVKAPLSNTPMRRTISSIQPFLPPLSFLCCSIHASLSLLLPLLSYFPFSSASVSGYLLYILHSQIISEESSDSEDDSGSLWNVRYCCFSFSFFLIVSQINQRYFGYFRCTRCNREWLSAHVWVKRYGTYQLVLFKSSPCSLFLFSLSPPFQS